MLDHGYIIIYSVYSILYMIMLSLKLVIISVSLVSIIVPYFRTIYGLGVLLEEVGNDNNSTSTNRQNLSDSELEQMALKFRQKSVLGRGWILSGPKIRLHCEQ